VLTDEMRAIIDASRERGWVLEPDAKRLLSMAGLDVPRFKWAKSSKEAVTAASEIGYPVVAKIISPNVLHKSDAGGVEVGITDEKRLTEVFKRFKKMEGFEGILIEEILTGTELIIGSKVDEQFGPVILLGIGGIAVEVYMDTAIRMAPLSKADVPSMVSSLEAHSLIEGFRGSKAVNMELLTSTTMKFSELVMDLGEDVTSIDLNPVMCTSRRCTVVDARIIL